MSAPSFLSKGETCLQARHFPNHSGWSGSVQLVIQVPPGQTSGLLLLEAVNRQVALFMAVEAFAFLHQLGSVIYLDSGVGQQQGSRFFLDSSAGS